MFGGDHDIHGHRPSSGDVTLNDPMRHNANALMNRFESGFALANRLDGESSKTTWTIQGELNTYA
jgi:hypothetical protein